MFRMQPVPLLLSLLAIAGTVFASTDRAPSATQLDWLAGCWGEIGKTSTEECWLPARGGTMLGVHRDAHADGAIFEYLRIVWQADGSVVYHASPMGKPATAFALVEVTARAVRFENPEHDWPQRIVYEQGPDDTLLVRAEGLASDSRRMHWAWQRLPCFPTRAD